MTPSRGPGPLVRAAVREGRPARTAADDAAGAGDEAARAARLRAVYDLAPIGLCLVDRRMRFLEVNDRLAALNGVPAAAHLGRTLREVLPPALADALEPAYARVLAAGEAIEDLEIARPAPAAGGGGAPRRWLVRLHPVPAPGGEGRGGARVEAVNVAVVDVTELRRAEEALRDSVEEFQAAFDQATVPMSQSDCATATFVRANPAFCRLVGRPAAELVGTPIAAVTHPEDREADLAGYRRMARGEAPAHEMEKRFVRPDGTVRWGRITVSPVRDRAGRPVRTVAVVEDVTERREAEERQRLLLREVDHRARNALAVVLAALRLTPREDAAAYARAVEGRVKALARAHTLLAEGRWSGADLGALAEGELAPFRLPPGAPAGAAPRVEVAGPAVHLAPAAAQGVSMALHELATNATKHGALSAPGGAVRLSWEIDRGAAVLRLLWEERGGPPVASPPTRRGFGTRVVEGTVRDQLGGRVARRWEAAGLACATEVPLARLARA